MFDEPKPNQPITPGKEPEDIFSETEPAAPSAPTNLPVGPTPTTPAKPEATPPRPEVVKPSTPPIPPAGMPQKKVPSVPSGGRVLKIFLGLLVVILVILVLSVGGWFVYNKFFAVSTTTPDTNINDNLNVPTNLNAPTNVNLPPEESVAEPEEPVLPMDTDGDGLTDEEEIALGINPNDTDSDSDGLFDYEEVNVYNTDPIVPDSDGDGYMDGEEVKNGYNPLGSGKLLDFNQINQ